jgi:ABC-type multidrug transport system permease subunit
LVELPWQTLLAVLTFITWYYPVGMHKNAEWTDTVNERSGLMFLLIWSFYMFASTFTMMVIAGIETAELGGNIANLLFTLTLIFCGYVIVIELERRD